MPLTAAEKKLPGLTDSVELWRDAFGVPHLYAANADDLFFAQGYMVGRDRLFQLALLQAVGRGRLSSLLGPRPLTTPQTPAPLRGKTLVDFDFALRAFGLERSGRASFDAVRPETRRVCERFAAGVNLAADELRERKPLELRLLKLDVPRWEAWDCALATRLIAFDLNYAWRMILTLGAISERAGADALAALTPRWPDGAPTITRHAETLAALEHAGRRLVGFDGRSKGSNNWVLAPGRTETGRPLLCNDPHLKLTAPSIWYEVHLCAEADGIDVYGVTLPGLPGVGIGHNRRIAWGATAGLTDDTDFYVERVDPRDPARYETEHGFEAFEFWEETVEVKKGAPVTRTLRRTRHGPVMTDVLGEPATTCGEPLSMRWTAHERTAELDAVLAVARASSWEEFREAVRVHGAPCFNFVYADVDGHIGYQLGGLVPIRRGFFGHTPLPGWDGKFEWDGFIPFDELPSRIDPPDGCLASANNPVSDDAYPHYVSVYWEPDHRITRILELLSRQPKHTLQGMSVMQSDLHSTHARRIQERLFRPMLAKPLPSARAQAVLERLCAWDCHSGPGSLDAAVFYACVQWLTEELLRPLLGDELLNAYLEVSNEVVFPLERVLSEPSGAAAKALLAGRDLDVLVTAALEAGAERAKDRRWGRLHRTFIRHALHDVPWLGKRLSIGPFERGGDGMTLDNGSYLMTAPFEHYVGASARMIWDVGDWDGSRIVVAGGESGNPFSPHFSDQARLWAQNETRPAPFTRAAVEASCARTMLRP
jgi:penicillin amidase